jgi:hypothetical protein
MNFHLINFPGLLLARAVSAPKKSLIAKNSRSHTKSNREEARELFITNSIKLKHVEFFN